MPRFPTREAEVASLAGTMIYGLTEFAGDFPSCPVAVETLKEALDSGQNTICIYRFGN